MCREISTLGDLQEVISGGKNMLLWKNILTVEIKINEWIWDVTWREN